MENTKSDGKKANAWRRRLKNYERSGLAQAAFCRQQGIPLSTFTLWKRRLLRTPAQKSPVAFIPVRLKEEPEAQTAAVQAAAAQTAATGAWACEIIGPQVRLRLRERPDAAGLRKLVAVVAGEASWC